MRQYLVFIVLNGNKTKRLKGHIIPERIAADDAGEALERAVKARYLKKKVSR